MWQLLFGRQASRCTSRVSHAATVLMACLCAGFLTADAHAAGVVHDFAQAVGNTRDEATSFRQEFPLVGSDCAVASVSLQNRGRVFVGTYEACGSTPLTFLWRAESGVIALSTSGARLGDLQVDLGNGTWIENPSMPSSVGARWRRELGIIVRALVAFDARTSAGKLQDWGAFGVPADDPDCLAHYMTYTWRDCPPCGFVNWFYADSRFATYAMGYKPLASNSCGCTPEKACTNLD